MADLVPEITNTDVMDMLGCNSMSKALDAAGANEQMVARVLKGHLEYEEPVPIKIQTANPDGQPTETIKIQRVDTPKAMRIQREALDLYFQVRGHYAPLRREMTARTRSDSSHLYGVIGSVQGDPELKALVIAAVKRDLDRPNGPAAPQLTVSPTVSPDDDDKPPVSG